jgi:hypothetical protein
MVHLHERGHVEGFGAAIGTLGISANLSGPDIYMAFIPGRVMDLSHYVIDLSVLRVVAVVE